MVEELGALWQPLNTGTVDIIAQLVSITASLQSVGSVQSRLSPLTSVISELTRVKRLKYLMRITVKCTMPNCREWPTVQRWGFSPVWRRMWTTSMYCALNGFSQRPHPSHRQTNWRRLADTCSWFRCYTHTDSCEQRACTVLWMASHSGHIRPTDRQTDDDLQTHAAGSDATHTKALNIL